MNYKIQVILAIVLLIIFIYIYYKYINDYIHNYRLQNDLFNMQKVNDDCKDMFSKYVNNYVFKPKQDFEDHVTIIVKTFLRPKCLLRLLFSIRKRYSYIRIIVADDSLYKFLKEGENSLNIFMIYLPFYVGSSEGRNNCVDMVDTKYTVLLDDDMIMIKNTKLEIFYDTIEKYNNDIDLLAGQLIDRYSYDALFKNINEKSIEIEKNKILKKNKKITWSHRQLNFFICKTMLLKNVKWDNILKTEEHTEHFYRIYLNGYKVANTKDVEIEHNNNCNDSYLYTLFRNQSNYKNYILNKHNLKKFGNDFKDDKQTIFEKTLLDANKNLRNIKFALSFGTALGYYREKQFINHDNDIDLIVFRKDIETENDIINAMSENFDLIHKRGKFEDGLEYTFRHKNTHVNLDIFIMYEEPNFYWYSSYEGLFYDIQIRFKFPKLEFNKVVFLNENFYITPTEYLNVDYGDSWIFPRDISYNYMMANDFGFRWFKDDEYENDCEVPVLSDNFITDYFKDNVFYINLDKDVDRNENVLNQFNKLKIKAQRFSAINGIDDEIVNEEFNKENTKITKNEIACTLSHRRIWENIVKNKTPWTLIFEDDIFIQEGITQKQFGEGMIESLCGKRNTQIVFFGACLNIDRYIKQQNLFFSVKVNNTKPNCTHAYAITWRMAKKLLENTVINDKPIDVKICNDVCNNNLCTIVSSKFKNNTYSFFNDVLSSIGLYKNEYFGDGIVLQNRDLYKSNLR